VTIALIFAAAISIAYPRSTPSARFQPPADCARYIHNGACANWKLGPWLPALEASGPSAATNVRDDFERNWRTGTPFTYGLAGPPSGSASYDRRNRIAFYYVGCCSWGSTVLAEGVGAPPVPVVDATLSVVQTTRGLRLGLTMARVQQLYGPATPSPARGVSGLTVLSYRHVIRQPCEQDVDVAFLHDRAVYIGINWGC
jgi:hypothetical protein